MLTLSAEHNALLALALLLLALAATPKGIDP